MSIQDNRTSGFYNTIFDQLIDHQKVQSATKAKTNFMDKYTMNWSGCAFLSSILPEGYTFGTTDDSGLGHCTVWCKGDSGVAENDHTFQTVKIVFVNDKQVIEHSVKGKAYYYLPVKCTFKER